jgi:hypothetical protein
MSPRTINIIMDEAEHKSALKKKGERTWKQVLKDGLEVQTKQD